MAKALVIALCSLVPGLFGASMLRKAQSMATEAEDYATRGVRVLGVVTDQQRQRYRDREHEERTRVTSTVSYEVEGQGSRTASLFEDLEVGKQYWLRYLPEAPERPRLEGSRGPVGLLRLFGCLGLFFCGFLLLAGGSKLLEARRKSPWQDDGRTLRLVGKGLERVEDSPDVAGVPLERLRRIERLELSMNRLVALPPWFGELDGLKELGLGMAKFDAFPPQVLERRGLEVLSLNAVPIGALPTGIGRLERLRVLNLGGCELTSLPPELGALKRLEHLRLSHNQLTRLPKVLGELESLKILELNGNPIVELDPDQVVQLLSPLSSLERVTLPKLPPRTLAAIRVRLPGVEVD